MRTFKAFTLIELLIVVAIIAILAAIAVPNFLESQTRAKVARVKSDIRVMVTGLEAYRVDYNKYPPSATPAEQLEGSVGFKYISTPVAYISGDVGLDVYEGRRDAAGRTYPYFAYGARTHDNQWATENIINSPFWFIVASKGPNLETDNFWDPIDNDDLDAFMLTHYDPTNGIISTGNIYRSGGDIRGNGADAARTVSQFKSGSTY